MSLPSKNRFDPTLPIDSKGNLPSQVFRDYIAKLDALVVALSAGNLGPLVNAASDAAAAKAGVAINQLYRNGNTVHVRIV